ncbi:MAG: hypothetical protein Q8O47_00755 [Candidatus Bathyarchaeota archaeon]|nr:hypothetical protein [Candidatus Bathyarchaeota archaeon]
MRNSVYAILAVVVGVMLVGLLPGQLSNLAAPAPARTNLQTGGAESTPNVTTTGGQYYDIVNGSIVTYSGSISNATSAADAAGKADEGSYQFSVISSPEAIDQYSNVKYYGMWGAGLVIAVAVYLASKRMLG